MDMNWNHMLVGAGMPGVDTSRYARLQLLAEKAGTVANVTAAYGIFSADTWHPTEAASAPPPSFVDPGCEYEGRGYEGWPPLPYIFHSDQSPDPLNYAFAFWNYAISTDPLTSGIESNRFPQITSVGPVEAKARAWYVRTWPSGPGDEQVYLDACYISPDSGELTFIPDDFVTIAPDESGDLTETANKGSIDTSLIQSPVTVTAAPQIGPVYEPRKAETNSPDDPGAIQHPTLKFSYWRRAAYTDILGSMESFSDRDFIVEHNADIYAWAVYDVVPWRLPESYVSDALFLLTGSDGPVFVVHVSDLVHGHWHPQPVPDPGFAAMLKSQLQDRVVRWTHSGVPNPADLRRLGELASSAEQARNGLIDLLTRIGRG